MVSLDPKDNYESRFSGLTRPSKVAADIARILAAYPKSGGTENVVPRGGHVYNYNLGRANERAIKEARNA